MSKEFRPIRAKLGFYTQEEILQMSVCEVTIPTSFDMYGYPVKDGLYDLRMGPLDMGQSCETCGLDIATCPGHFGHINLSKPVLNPLIFDTLYGILRSSCFDCKKFLISDTERLQILSDIETNKIGLPKIETNSIQFLNKLLEESEKSNNPFLNTIHFTRVGNFLKKCATKLKCPNCKSRSALLSKGGNCRILRKIDNSINCLDGDFLKNSIFNLFENESVLFKSFFFISTPNMFFIETMPIIPNKFRPPRFVEGKAFEHSLNSGFTKIIQYSTLLENDSKYYSDLQQFVHSYFDSGKMTGAQGHKQILEKKEGLFRKNIMGKRVNFSARSVISPDPNLGTREIGVPLIFAKCLTFPEKVTSINHDKMKEAVSNGPSEYPGANFVKTKDGLINLKFISEEKRQVLANTLMEGKIVYRHLKDGDFVLVNRQPTLHSVSLMGHTVKVLKNENTLRMHYVNCKPYNADFDGDEMNIHFPQNYNSTSEIANLSLNDFNFFVPSTGDPIRGLAQDHIVAAANLTMKDSFYTKEEYHSLIHSGLSNIINNNKKYKFLNPCISSPIELYSGKQIVSTILINLGILITLEIKSKIKYTCYDNLNDDNNIHNNLHNTSNIINSNTSNKYVSDDNITTFINGIMIKGILDKATLGTSSYSLIHASGEIYGYSICNDLLTVFSRIVNNYLFMRGFSIRFDDLLISNKSEIKRQEIFKKGFEDSIKFQLSNNFDKIDYLNDNIVKELDGSMRGYMNSITSKAIEILEFGTLKTFPKNNMANTINSGAKGSMVNMSQISLCLGQQELEGRRVPFMISGKTLPCFSKLDLSPSAGGYIFERFLTGIDPATFFFHCMAGREGLIDTAVKTANSGYLQRCLVKHLEGVYVEYDNTVRLDGKILQFTYGDDGIDCVKDLYLKNVEFYENNSVGLFTNTCDINTNINNISNINNTSNITNIEFMYDNYIPDNYKNIFNKSKNDSIKLFLKNKYINSLVNPGHSVGIIAAQSIGEPSTQMTLNTFHLAGVGGKNVTLGIPRLREIVLVASKQIKTPTITIPLFDDISLNDSNIINKISNIFKRITLDECLESIGLNEQIVIKKGSYKKHISITFKIRDLPEQCSRSIDNEFLKKLGKEIKKRTSEVGISELRSIEKLKIEKDSDDSSDINDNDNDEIEVNDVTTDVNDNINELNDNINDVSGFLADLPENEDLEDDQEETEKYTNLSKINSNTFVFDIFYSADFKILLLPIIELICKKIVVKEIDGYSNGTFNDNNFILEGSNFIELTSCYENIDLFKKLDFYRSYSNDIYSIYKNFGVEAARTAIVTEIESVFDVYGININIRHLYLVADYMTKDGDYKAFNRGTFNMDNSFLQKMSFESCFTNLKNAALFHQTDPLINPSAAITFGNSIRNGTGAFDLLYQIQLGE